MFGVGKGHFSIVSIYHLNSVSYIYVANLFLIHSCTRTITIKVCIQFICTHSSSVAIEIIEQYREIMVFKIFLDIVSIYYPYLRDIVLGF